MKILVAIGILGLALSANSCRKKGCLDETALNYSEEAKKDDGSCTYLNVPTTYSFTDENGNSTVSYQGQTDRIKQLKELSTYLKSGTTAILSEESLHFMFENFEGDGGGNFSFSSTKQLKDKCFASDISLFESYLTAQATSSLSYEETASSGQAGTLSSGTSTYLFSATGKEYAQIIEKGLMGAIFMNQALAVYFSDEKMNVDNTTAVDAAGGEYFTEMEHHWDEAFGYFGVPIDFPTNTSDLLFWAKYCNGQDSQLNCNAILMNAFLKGRAAISEGDLNDIRNEQIAIIRQTWEKLIAAQAVSYLEEAKSNFGLDNAKFLHELSEAYGFILCLKYVPLETRIISYSSINTLLTENLGDDFWAISIADMNTAISTLTTTYSL